MKTEDLSGRVAVVTGGTRGIGRAVADALHGAGAHVALTGRQGDTVAAAAREVGSGCRGYVCDQRDPEAVEAMAAAVVQDMGPVGILVNNAGRIRGGRVDEMDLDLWNDVLATNLTGVFWTTRCFLPSMRSNGGGDIFMISSMSGKKGDPGGGAYAASKFGLQGFSQSLMYEVRGDDIRVMVINPSSVDTGPVPPRERGAGLYLHAVDLAATVVHLACLPGRTLVRDMDVFGTHPPGL